MMETSSVYPIDDDNNSSDYITSLADLIMNLNSGSAVARQQRIENIAALDHLSAQLKENMYLLEALQEITHEFLAQSMQRFAEAANDLESWRAQHHN